MKIKHDAKAGIATPCQCLAEQLKSIGIAIAIFIPHLHFIDGKTDVVESDRVYECNILLSEEGGAFFAPARALGKPVCDICSPLYAKGRTPTLVRRYF